MAQFDNVEEIFAAFGELFDGFFANLPDIAVNAALDDDEAAAGTTKDLAIRRRVSCTACDGVGGDRRIECTACDGKGGQKQAHGFVTTATTCKSCHGRGATYPNPCTTCKGARTQLAPATVRVAIPAGSSHASTIRVAGEGNPKADGTRGDLLVFLLVGGRPDPRADQPIVIPHAPELPRAIARQPSDGGGALIAAVVFIAISIAVVVAMMH